MIEQITKLENSDSAFSITQISDLYLNYASFVEKYPDDERAPEFLFKAAQRSSILNKAKEGIGFFENNPKNSFRFSFFILYFFAICGYL